MHTVDGANDQHSSSSPTPIASNQWYSNIYTTFPTQPIFAFPLAYRLSANGLGMSYPTVVKSSDTIFGSYDEDLAVGLPSAVTKPQIETKGDWSVGLVMNNYNTFLRFTLVQGAPWTVIHTNNKQLIIRLQHPYVFYNQGTTQINDTHSTTDTFRLLINNHNYIVVLSQKQLITLSSNEIQIPTNRIFIGLLTSPYNFALFKNHANSEITNTRVNWDIKNNQLITTYQFIGNNTNPLITLFPHQYDSLTKRPKVLGNYQTIRGALRLVNIPSFTTQLPLIVPEQRFTSLKQNHPDFITAVKQDQQKLLTDNQPTKGDYFLGTWYGKAANVLLLLDAASLQKEKQELLAYLKPRFSQSLTYFTYQKNLQSVIADQPEFGNEKLNDHHFHYGYYIRTAAILVSVDPSYKNVVENKINLLIEDIAYIDRKSSMFPFLRNFNIYEGHSYADGFANFGDGNDQESSSEAINAWYGIYLWAKVANNKQLEKTALYLYNTEIQGTRYYWFGKNGEYTQSYNHAIGSIIWGGKIDFSTWFSGKTNMKYGIQILPITPGSFSYLGTLGNFTNFENDFSQHGGDISDDWGDLFVLFTSFYQPEKALKLKDQVNKPETNTPHSLFLYTLYHNTNL